MSMSPRSKFLGAIALVTVVIGLSFAGYRLWQYQELESLRTGVSQLKAGKYESAERMIRPFAEMGNRFAQEQLGFMHALGLGVPKDQRQAANWFRRAECGCVDTGSAEYRIALDYLNGSEGATQDSFLAVQWLERAAEAGNESAQRILADSESVEQSDLLIDPELSAYWQAFLAADHQSR